MPGPSPSKPPAKKAGTAAQPPDVMLGDHVYATHPERGPIAVQVTAVGKDGFRGVCDQKVKHGIPFDAYIGHKARAAHRFDVVDQGADGAIVRDAGGNSRFLHGKIPVPPGPPAAPAPPTDDPLTGGLGQLGKAFEAEPMHIPDGRRLLLKAAGVALKNRPGLALKDTTDKDGTQTHRWVSTEQKPAGGGAGGPMKHGDTVGFRHGQVEGQGKIVASGHAGVTLQDDGGREHKVRHEHLTGPADEGHAAAGNGGGNMGAKTAENAPQEAGAPPDKRGEKPAAAAAGNGGGNTALPDKGEGGKPFFDPAVVAKLPPKAAQPIKDKDALFKASAAALEHMRTWLNKGKGLASQAGAQTMSKGPGDVTPEEWAKPGAMLFIAGLKGEPRAAEKVASDYGGDWSQLKDTVRGSIAVDTIDDLHGMVEKLNAGGMKLAQQPKDRFAKPTAEGYRDMLLNIEFPGGLIGELQLHVKSMLNAKNEGHHHYEVSRTLVSKQNAGSLSDAEQKTLDEAIDKQKQVYAQAWDAASGSSRVSGGAGGDMMTKALGEGFKFFEKDDAQFRQRAGMRGVQDVLHGDTWKPYQGDAWAPVVHGNEVTDPLAGGTGGPDGNGGEPMAKAEDDGPRLLLLKAQIPDARSSDLFAAPSQVRGHMHGNSYVAPYQATRHKRAAGKPEPAPVSDAEAKDLSIGAFKRHDAWRKSYGKNPPSRSYAGILGSHLDAIGRKVSSDDEGRILAAMKKHTDDVIAAMSTGKGVSEPDGHPSVPDDPAVVPAASPRWFIPSTPTPKERAKRARFERQILRMQSGGSSGGMLKALGERVLALLVRRKSL